MQIAAELTLAQAAGARRAERTNVTIGAGMSAQRMAGAPALVLDLSPFGFRVQTREPLAPGAVAWLKLRGLEASQARVVWSDGHIAGCAFAAPLNPVAVAALVAEATREESAAPHPSGE